jgi:ubiquinone/menaquinone biosynthesis C-methylase UbiE
MDNADPTIAALQSEQPFDAVAGEYDATFTRRQLGRWLREAVHRHLAGLVRPGDEALELGCGTGEDALWLARCGAQVVATDASAVMLAVASRKAAATEVAQQITFAQLDLSKIGNVSNTAGVGALAGAWESGIGYRSRRSGRGGSGSDSEPYSLLPTPHSRYDAVLANFGVLNCLPDRRPLAEVLARWVRPGGRVALVMMSPLCPWEIAWYTAHGQIRPGFRRLRSGVEARLGDSATVRVWYPSARRLRAEFAPDFRPVQAAGIGVLLPPSYLSHLVDRRPRLFARLAAWETRLPGRFPWTWPADHYLQVFERRQVL